MIVIDSSGWMEFFAGSAQGMKLLPFIEKPQELVVPAITIYEVFKKILQQRDEEEALRAAGLMSAGEVVDLTRDQAIEAALISAEHKLPMADSIIYATALSHDAEVWTLDAHFKGLAGVVYLEK
ncbi:MAG: VapC toxin family PIN domain ribonuclease [Anaerolinea sp.]|nr:VapC toxin family PIN domain ribonuclease [Anaerolinea sp.]